MLRTGICGTDLHVMVVGRAGRRQRCRRQSSSATRSPAGWRLWAAASTPSTSATWSASRGTSSAAGAGPAWPDAASSAAHTVSIGIDRDGGFAEYVAVPATNVWRHRLPLDPDVAAIFDPFGNAVHSALAFPVLGEDVLITGAGPIGVMAASVARHAGARHVVITDISPERSSSRGPWARSTRAVDVTPTSLDDVMKDLGMVEGFDVGLEMSGAPAALHSMIESMANGGDIALLGLPARRSTSTGTGSSTRCSPSRASSDGEMYETWYAMSVLVQAGLDISPVITDRFHFTEWEKAFETAAGGHGGKVVISWE